MQHFILVFYLLTVVVGVSAVAVAAFVYVRIRDPLLQRYVVLASAFTAFVLAYALLSYANVNLPDIGLGPQFVIVVIAMLSSFYLMFAVPYFAHGLVWPDPARWPDICVRVDCAC